MLLGFVALRIVNAVLTSQLGAKLEGYRRAGQPAELSDLQPRPVEPADNAALTLLEANRLIELDGRQEHVAMRPDPRWIQEQHELVREAVQDNSQTIQQAHLARGMKGVDWGLDYSSFEKVTTDALPFLSQTKRLCYFLATAANWEAQVGQDSQSIACVQDILRASQAVDQIPLLVTDLVAVSITALACSTTEGAMPHWGLKDPQTRQTAQDLLGQLLDETSFFATGQRSWWGERGFFLDIFRIVSRVGGVRPSLHMLWVPFCQWDSLRMMDDLTQTAEAASQPSYPQAMAMMPSSSPPGRISRFLRPLSSIVPDPHPLVLQLRYRALAQRRLAAVGLAMALFQADHGRLPTSLLELAPQYLRALPIDPFSGNADPPRIAEAGPARVYSVGVDGVDDGGMDADSLDKGDILFYLAGGRERPPLEPIPDEVASQPAQVDGTEMQRVLGS
jgi:hypothetical protein